MKHKIQLMFTLVVEKKLKLRIVHESEISITIITHIYAPNLHCMGVSALEYLLPDHPIKVTIYLYACIEVVLSINPINTIVKGTVSSRSEHTFYKQGMESVSKFKMNTVTENYCLIYAAATRLSPYHVSIIFSH